MRVHYPLLGGPVTVVTAVVVPNSTGPAGGFLYWGSSSNFLYWGSVSDYPTWG